MISYTIIMYHIICCYTIHYMLFTFTQIPQAEHIMRQTYHTLLDPGLRVGRGLSDDFVSFFSPLLVKGLAQPRDRDHKQVTSTVSCVTVMPIVLMQE